MRNKEENYSTLEYLLLAFVPFSGPNTDLLYRRGRFMRKISGMTGSSVNSIESTITRAKKNGYLEEVEEKGREGLKITNKGRVKILKLLISDKKEKWDDQWRIIVFDIPENKRKTRDNFRRILKELRFKKMQRSVWICPYDRTEELEMVIDELYIRPYIQYFISKSVTEEEKLKKIFKLG
jgi:phenylacetic acid degradation operon negative regulatory protein